MIEATKLHATPVLTAVDTFFDALFEVIADWKPRLRAELETAHHAGGLTGAQLAALVEPGASAVLDGTALPLYGAGFCAADVLVTEGNPLAWWQGPERTQLASSTFGPGQAAIDLHRLEWYRVPAETGTGHVAGPFVDYLCSNEITLTAAMPLEIDGTFAGVLCADVLVSALERVLLPSMMQLGAATLVNHSGRVVLSTNGISQTGDRVAGWRCTDTSVQRIDSGRHPFSLILEPGI